MLFCLPYYRVCESSLLDCFCLLSPLYLPICSHGVVPSCAIRESRLCGLEKKGFLPPKDVSRWRLEAEGEVPRPKDDEVIMPTSFYKREFGLPLHPFVHRILHYYQVEI